MGIYVKADRTRLKQVLINLLSNAVKYNREGGTVEVSWRRTGLVSRQYQGYWPGIAAGETDAAFSTIQSARARDWLRRRHRHRVGGHQATGRTDGRRNWCRKYCRGWQRILVRASSAMSLKVLQPQTQPKSSRQRILERLVNAYSCHATASWDDKTDPKPYLARCGP